MISLRRMLPALSLCCLVLPGSLRAEVELSFYGGVQRSPPSRVSGTDGTLGPVDTVMVWEGRSLTMPPYYGLRGTLWQTEVLGFGFGFTHEKVYADDASLAATGYDIFEFSDGLNIVTANAVRRWPAAFGGLTPYVGGGLGLSIPHVEVQAPGGPKTFEYQVAGPAARLFAGVMVDLSEDWSLFGEVEATYSANTVDLADSGELKTDILTEAINLGVSYTF